MDTGDQTLPVQIAKSWWPSLRVLGGDCEFQGRAQIEQHDLQTHASLAGKLSHVDLSELVTRQFPRILSGTADLELNEVSITDNQLEILVGRLHSNHGQIGQPFLKALQRELGLVAVAEVTNSVLPYQTLDVRFHLQGSTFQFAATQPKWLSDHRHRRLSDSRRGQQTPVETSRSGPHFVSEVKFKSH